MNDATDQAMRDGFIELERQTDVLVAALIEIADKDAWALKYPYGSYECIATDCIGIARAALAKAGVK